MVWYQDLWTGMGLVSPGDPRPLSHLLLLLLLLEEPQGSCTDPLSVTVTRSKNLLGKVILRCWAFSFYPRGTTLTWLRDGDPMHQGTFGPGVSLPSGDGTYQTWVDTQILPGEEQRFACHVGHCGLNITVPAVSGTQGQSASCAAAPAAAPLAVSTVAAVLYLVVVEA
ncbi:MHC class I-like protein MILL2 [Diceros bicornis minor]|uniref:MHC class I-like protein MILL2 n=1 Tax=Diceros bicornis minor TaxID=77932 RepID=UPI0026F1C58A|nr:MHC class I-like protein MILL2 [Diceros bicornis minor]